MIISKTRLDTLSHEHLGTVVLGGSSEETKWEPGQTRSQVIPLSMIHNRFLEKGMIIIVSLQISRNSKFEQLLKFLFS